MKLKGVIGNLAGQGAFVAILLLVLVIALAGGPLLLQKQSAAIRLGSELGIAKAHAIANALLARAQPGQALDYEGDSYHAYHLPNALTTGASGTLEQTSAVKKLRADPTQPVADITQHDRGPILHYAVADGHGGVLFLEMPLRQDLTTVFRYFGQSYLSGTALGYLLIGLLLSAAFGMRIFLRKLAQLPPGERRQAIAAGLSDFDGRPRRNLFPWLLALCACVFFVDVLNWMDSIVGIGYIVAVMLAPSSNRSWHSIAIAGVGVLMLLIAPILEPVDLAWWMYQQNRAVTIFAIICLFGSSHIRGARAEAKAQSAATRSSSEAMELRVALGRAEAAEAERRQAVERMTMANQAAGVSLWEWDLKTDQVTISEGSPLIARLGKTQLHRSSVYTNEIVHPDDRETYRAAFINAKVYVPGGNDLFDLQYRACCADGQIRHIHFHAQVVREPDGKPIRIIGVDWDVTRAVEAARELHDQAMQLREAESRLRRASVSSLEAHWDVDLTKPNDPCWFSPSFAALTGHPAEYLATFTPRALMELTHPDEREAQRNAMRLQGHAYDLPIRVLVASGEYRWFQMRGAVEHNDAGEAVRVAGSLRDIHQQKLSEDLLRETQKRFERAISGAQDALFDSDLVEGTTWRSPRFFEMLGYAPEEVDSIRSRNFDAFVHPEDGPAVGKVAAAHLRDNSPYDVEYRLRRKDGSWIWVRERAMAERDSTGKPVRLAGSIRDSTEQRAARDEMIIATAEAEHASRAKSTFLATMSHEIRTPMNGVIGMTGLLLDTGLDRVQRDYAETIRASADSLLTILNDILDFSKIEAGKLDIESIEMDLSANVDDVGSIMAFQAAAKGLELVVNVRPEVPDRVLGDPQRIRQCLLNLVGNAIKFTQTGEVVLEVCSLGQQNGRSLVHFEVRDTGIGIAPDAIQKLFQPFTQADSSTTRKYGGTGLGLSIVRKLVEMMGGQTGAQSEPDKGSTFWFTVPLEPIVTAEQETRTAISPRDKRVLLVDDNETNRRVLSSQMMHSGYGVETAASAEEALKILRAQSTPFDVIVLDYHMPDMDGAMLGEQIMQSQQIAPTRLMLLTSLDRSGDMQRFAEIGFSAYLTKPVRRRELLDCLDKTLSRNVEDWHLRSQPIITRGTLIATEGRRHYAGKVLLVEDNLINQRVARRFLERLGCEVQVVGDGAQAVTAYQQHTFGLVLMDMQMPVMDGIEATRRIRELENSGLRTPIVALTANAMMGTLERCLDAGMDDYLTKPLDISRLQDVLDRLFRNGNVPAAQTGGPESVVNDAVQEIQAQRLLEQPAAAIELEPAIRSRLADIAGDDTEFAGELINAFIMGSEESIREMRAAVVSKDRGAMARAAHRLKGASANLHIDALATLAGAVESRAKAGRDDGTDTSLDRISAELDRVRQALQREIHREPPHRAAASQ